MIAMKLNCRNKFALTNELLCQQQSCTCFVGEDGDLGSRIYWFPILALLTIVFVICGCDMGSPEYREFQMKVSFADDLSEVELSSLSSFRIRIIAVVCSGRSSNGELSKPGGKQTPNHEFSARYESKRIPDFVVVEVWNGDEFKQSEIFEFTESQNPDVWLSPILVSEASEIYLELLDSSPIKIGDDKKALTRFRLKEVPNRMTGKGAK